jgi:hypothetical protein
MRAKYPAEFQSHWVSYAGTGRNIFGQITLYGHGLPGPIVLVEPEAIDKYCAKVSDTEKRQLYDIFEHAKPEQVQEMVERIYGLPATQKTEPLLSPRGQ